MMFIEPCNRQLKALYALFQVLLKARHKRGAIDFETIETMMLFNELGKIDNIVPVHRNDAHRVIEECMLAANVCASAFLEKNKQPCLYRIHEGPTPENSKVCAVFCKSLDWACPVARVRRPRTMGRCLKRLSHDRMHNCCNSDAALAASGDV